MTEKKKKYGLDSVEAFMRDNDIPISDISPDQDGRTKALQNDLLEAVARHGLKWIDEGVNESASKSQVMTAATLFLGALLAANLVEVKDETLRADGLERALKIVANTLPAAAQLYLDELDTLKEIEELNNLDGQSSAKH